MINTIDIEIKRLLDSLSGDPLVIIVSDNGTPSSLTTDPWNSNKAKGTVGQGGVLVPFIAFGDTVQADQTLEQAVSLNDLYATILDFAGKSIPGGADAKSLKDLLTGTSSTAPHTLNYTETFFPNFDPATEFGPCRGQQAVQEDPGEYVTDTYKYIRRMGGQEALYELDGDFDEDDNLIADPPNANRLQALEDYIDLTLDSDLASICGDSSKGDIGATCSQNSDCCSNACSTATLKCVCPSS